MALELGWSHSQIGQLSYHEYVRWRAYMTYRQAMRDHAANVAAARARR